MSSVSFDPNTDISRDAGMPPIDSGAMVTFAIVVVAAFAIIYFLRAR